MKTYPYIGYKQRGKLVVTSEKHKQKVLDFLKEQDSFEQEYMPDDFIEVSDNVAYSKTIYTIYMGKYDPNMKELWNWSYEMNVPLAYYYEDQQEMNPQFYSTQEQAPLTIELYNSIKNLYDKVTNIRGVDIESVYAVEECKQAKRAIKRFEDEKI